MPGTFPTLTIHCESGGEADHVRAIFFYRSSANDWLTSCRLWKVPPAPRLTAIPLPRVIPDDDIWGPGDVYGGGGGGDDGFPAQEAGISGCLAAAKPKVIKNGARPGVGFFLPRQKSHFILMGLAIVRQPICCLGFGDQPQPDRGLRGEGRYLTRIRVSVSDLERINSLVGWVVWWVDR